MLRDLRKHEFAQVHRYPPRMSCSQDRKSMTCVSNRDQKKTWFFLVTIRQLARFQR
jgi:hypothetical protein